MLEAKELCDSDRSDLRGFFHGALAPGCHDGHGLNSEIDSRECKKTGQISICKFREARLPGPCLQDRIRRIRSNCRNKSFHDLLDENLRGLAAGLEDDGCKVVVPLSG